MAFHCCTKYSQYSIAEFSLNTAALFLMSGAIVAWEAKFVRGSQILFSMIISLELRIFWLEWWYNSMKTFYFYCFSHLYKIQSILLKMFSLKINQINHQRSSSYFRESTSSHKSQTEQTKYKVWLWLPAEWRAQLEAKSIYWYQSASWDPCRHLVIVALGELRECSGEAWGELREFRESSESSNIFRKSSRRGS